MRPSFDLIYPLIQLAIGLALIYWHRLISAVGLRAIILFIGVSLLLHGIFKVLTYVIKSLPFAHLKRLSSAVGLLIAGTYYVIHAQSTIWKSLAWIIVIVGFVGVIAALQMIVLDVIMLTELFQAFNARPRPRSGVPFTYVLSDRGYAAWYSHRFVPKMVQSLWKYRSLGSESRAILSRQGTVNRRTFQWLPRKRIIVHFLVSDSVRSFSSEFRTWLTRQACAFIVLRTPFDEGNVAFQAEAVSGFKDCPGPTFQVFVRDRKKRKVLSSYQGDEIIQVIRGVRESLLEDLIAPVTDRLVATALPIAKSDERLSEDLRLIIGDIPTSGLPPIADCYLRVRLARSDLERFLALLDGIELLLKLSAIVLLAQRWNDKRENGSPARLREPRPLTMGSWVSLLESFVRKDQSERITGEVSTFWTSEIADIQFELVNSARTIGFSVPEIRTQNQLGWISWVTHFRNVTKGHGVLKEEFVAPAPLSRGFPSYGIRTQSAYPVVSFDGD
jgi:hypothetical protein